MNPVRNSAVKMPAEEFSNNAEFIEELNRLRKENNRLKEEREILNKAAAYSSGQCNKRRKFIVSALRTTFLIYYAALASPDLIFQTNNFS